MRLLSVFQAHQTPALEVVDPEEPFMYGRKSRCHQKIVCSAVVCLIVAISGADVRGQQGTKATGVAAHEAPITFRQPDGPTCDVDVLLDGKPYFRLLVPEHLSADGGQGPLSGVPQFIHLVKGRWRAIGQVLEGTLNVNDDLAMSVRLEPAGREVLVTMAVTNLSQRPLHGVRANVCAGVNRLPSSTAWSNRQFIPESVPLDRDQQGRYWYEHVTPHGLSAWLPAKGWTPIHLNPDHPDASKIDRYFAPQSESAAARACAVESLDGKSIFFQAWNAPCYWIAPFPGNACTHLLPLVAQRLAPGQTVSIRGLTGVYGGTRKELTARLEKFLKQT